MKAANAGQALALVTVDEFVRCGMTHVCLAPGSRSTPMALALAQNRALDLHVVIDERSAGFLALGIAKQSRKPVGVLTTSGTATANLLPAVVEARLSAVPLIVLTADRPPELRDTGAGQTIDQVKLYGPYVKWYAEAGVPESREGAVAYWRSLACRAWAEAAAVPAGPVHLNMPFRDPLVPVADEAGFPFSLEGRPSGRPWQQFRAARNSPAPEDVLQLVEEVRTVEKGLVLTGFADWRGPEGAGGHAAAQLAAQIGWPLLAEATSGARTGYPAVSAYDALLRTPSFAKSHRPEMVLKIGSTGLSSVLNQMLDPSVRQVVVHDGPFVPDPGRASSLVIRADAASFCQAFSDGFGPGRPTAWCADWCRAESAAREAIDRALDGHCELNEPALARDLAACLPPGANLVAASSMPVRDLDWFMRPRSGLNLFSNRGANGIDGFVSTVLGIALSSGGYTAALCGDLSLLHDQNGLIYASNNPVGAAFVVPNNNGGGIFSFLPQAEDDTNFERLFGTPHNMDLKALAATYGIGHTLLGARDQLPPALDEARHSGGVHIIEARTERAANVSFHREVWQEVAGALEGAFSEAD